MNPNIHPKIAATGATGSLGVIVTYILSELNVQLPPEVWVAAVTLVSLVVGWFTPSPDLPVKPVRPRKPKP